MTTASHKTLQVLEQIVKVVPVGINLALLQLMWVMITGTFLSSRGAVHSALARSGFEAGEIRRSWRALRWGQLGTNCTARRPYLPDYKGRGRPPTRGILVRPLARKWKDRTLPAKPPDVTTSFIFEARTITASGWPDVMRAGLNVADDHELYSIWVLADPLFKTPLVLGTNLSVTPEVIFNLYLDRWPVEQIPLVAKQLLGCQRQFVFAHTSCWRLGELALLVGNILTWLAVLLPPQPSGYGDRHPKKHQDGYAGSWPGQFFQRTPFLMGDFVKNGRRRTIYQRKLRLIAGLSVLLTPNPAISGPHC
jgi:hypothetical protein